MCPHNHYFRLAVNTTYTLAKPCSDMSTLIVFWVEDEGLDVENDARYNGTATQVVSIDGANEFNGSLDDDGARFDNNANDYYNGGNTATQTVNVTGSNQFNNNAESGVYARNQSYYDDDFATQNINIGADNQLSGNQEYGLSAYNTGYDGSPANATQTIDLSGANVTGNVLGNVYAANEYAAYGTQTITGP